MKLMAKFNMNERYDIVKIEVGITDNDGDKFFWEVFWPAAPASDEFYYVGAGVLGQMLRDKFEPSKEWDSYTLGKWIEKALKSANLPVEWMTI